MGPTFFHTQDDAGGALVARKILRRAIWGCGRGTVAAAPGCNGCAWLKRLCLAVTVLLFATGLLRALERQRVLARAAPERCPVCLIEASPPDTHAHASREYRRAGARFRVFTAFWMSGTRQRTHIQREATGIALAVGRNTV
eukprot:6183003-Pleurochrysis_carterae.AAC.3